MAIRHQDLIAGPQAVIYRFPSRKVRSAAARRARMQVRRRRSATVALALLLVVAFLLATGPSGSAPASAPGAPKAVTLQSGDTLWELAELYAPTGMDLRAYVGAIEELNDLEGAPAAGMRLRLPR